MPTRTTIALGGVVGALSLVGAAVVATAALSVIVARKVLQWLEAHKYDPARPERVGYAIVDLPTYLREVAASPPQMKKNAISR